MSTPPSVNSNVNTNAENGSESFLCINVYIVIDTMLSFDVDTNADVKCEQAFIIRLYITQNCNGII